MKIGEVLRALRIERDLTLEALALEIDVSPSYLSRVEQGKREITERVLRRLSKELGTTVAQVYTKADGKPSKVPMPASVRDAESGDYKSDAVRLRRAFRDLTPMNQRLILEMTRLMLKLQSK